MVTLNSEGTPKDIGVELFCTKDTGEQFTFYVGIVLLHRCTALEAKATGQPS